MRICKRMNTIKQKSANGNLKNTTASIVDLLGALIGGLCAIHCIGMSLIGLMLMMGSFGGLDLHQHWMHEVIIGTTIIFAILGCILNRKNTNFHKKLILGVVLILVAEIFFSETIYSQIMMGFGGTILFITHWKNRKTKSCCSGNPNFSS